jgi:hypothetical protein
MGTILLTRHAGVGTKTHMPRRKLFDKYVNLPLTAAQLARIDAAVRGDLGEYRVDLIRKGIERELQARESSTKAAKAKPARRGPRP